MTPWQLSVLCRLRSPPAPACLREEMWWSRIGDTHMHAPYACTTHTHIIITHMQVHLPHILIHTAYMLATCTPDQIAYHLIIYQAWQSPGRPAWLILSLSPASTILKMPVQWTCRYLTSSTTPFSWWYNYSANQVSCTPSWQWYTEGKQYSGQTTFSKLSPSMYNYNNSWPTIRMANVTLCVEELQYL